MAENPGSDIRPNPNPEPEPEVERLPRDHGFREVAEPRRGAVRYAFAIALVADLVQWVLMPVYLVGAAALWNNVLDVAVAFLLVRLLKWHWAFLPTFVVELLPVLDLIPTWTMAVWIVTRSKAAPRG